MTTKDLLALMRLLSALESWAMSQKEPMPCYLSDDISAMIQKIEHEILRTRQGLGTSMMDKAAGGSRHPLYEQSSPPCERRSKPK